MAKATPRRLEIMFSDSDYLPTMEGILEHVKENHWDEIAATFPDVTKSEVAKEEFGLGSYWMFEWGVEFHFVFKAYQCGLVMIG